MSSTISTNAQPDTTRFAGPVVALARSTKAELLRLRKWPAVWVMLGVWLLLSFTFAYVFSYIAYRTGSSPFGEEGSDALLADLLPEAVPRIFTGGMPMFGGAIMLTLGALVTGSGYGWGTWKTVFTQGPSRVSAFGGTLVALAITVVGAVVLTFVFDLAVSTAIAAMETDTIPWPNLADSAQSMGGGILIFGMWTAAGALIGVLTRSPALAIGLGLVWSLVVENLLRSVSGLLSGLKYVTDVLPGTAAGSMSGALGSAAESGGGAPGVLTILDAPLAAGLLSAYLVVFAVLATVVTVRRDTA